MGAAGEGLGPLEERIAALRVRHAELSDARLKALKEGDLAAVSDIVGQQRVLTREIEEADVERIAAIQRAELEIIYGKLIEVQGGKFRMGGEDADASPDELPVQDIELPNFKMGETVVTNAQAGRVWDDLAGLDYAIIGTEKKNPYCWIVGRFATQEEADAKAAQISAGELRIPELNYSTSDGHRYYNDFFGSKIFETGVASQENPNGLQVVRVRPVHIVDSRVSKANRPATLRWAEGLSIVDFIGRKLTGRSGRLPSAAEEEFTRRGGIDPQTKQCRNFKYGTNDGTIPNGSNADFGRTYDFERIYSDDNGPKDVDAVPVNPLGVRIKGVLEWCNGWYGPLEGLSKTIAGSLNPDESDEEDASRERELRGVEWDTVSFKLARAAVRHSRDPGDYLSILGFRAVVVPQD
ncbi:MAG: SUMF1/EgtB/PvdO family nonheme iron enzyme [Deltaproteobacteria bacterium]|nr:SUMF1/EgtB/PvdO family nonheme iron enzyme [Deltaproteobacteria bacterium]